MLINTEAVTPSALDAAVVNLIRVRGLDGKYKSCDQCGRADIEDDTPEVRVSATSATLAARGP